MNTELHLYKRQSGKTQRIKDIAITISGNAKDMLIIVSTQEQRKTYIDYFKQFIRNEFLPHIEVFSDKIVDHLRGKYITRIYFDEILPDMPSTCDTIEKIILYMRPLLVSFVGTPFSMIEPSMKNKFDFIGVDKESMWALKDIV